MFKRTKLWAGLSAATLVGATGLAGCTTDNTVEQTTQVVEVAKTAIKAESVITAASDGEGEGEVATDSNLATNDLAYLTQLGLMRGHLHVGYQLYQAGHLGHAKTHMKHPESELYADIAPAFVARNVDGFAQELKALATAVEQDLGKEAVTVTYDKLAIAIAKSASVINQTSQSPAEQLKLVMQLLRVAGEEYAIAVVDGKMQNAHEYQDAFGFTSIAKVVIAGMDSNVEAKQTASDIVEALNPLWPSLIPPETLTTEAGELYGAAAKIEVLSLSI